MVVPQVSHSHPYVTARSQDDDASDAGEAPGRLQVNDAADTSENDQRSQDGYSRIQA